MPRIMKRASIRQLVHAAKLVGEATGVERATYCFEGRLMVPLAAGWALVLSMDDAERLRIDACLSGRVRASMWCLADDEERLAELALAAEAEAAALVA